jgi:hypothetical protein
MGGSNAVQLQTLKGRAELATRAIQTNKLYKAMV